MASWIDSFNRYFEVESVNSPLLIEQSFRLRYQVYCLEHSFENPSDFPDELEKDAYDECSAHSLLRYLPSACVVGTVRLVLPDTDVIESKLPIEEHCVISGAPGKDKRGDDLIKKIVRGEIAEVSRFCISKDFRKRLGEQESPHGLPEDFNYTNQVDNRRVIPHMTVGLIRGMFQLSKEQGIAMWYAAMEPALIRSLRRFGMYFHTIGPVVDFHGRRQPCIGDVATIAAEMKQKDTNIWKLVTQEGDFVPGQ